MICSATRSCSELILQLLVYGVSNGAVLALNAIGVTVIYGTVRILNLAHGDVFALASALMTTLITSWGVQRNWPIPLLISVLGLILLLTLLGTALLMALIDRSAFKPFRGQSQLAPLIATLGISLVLYQFALIWRTLLPSWIPQDHRSVPGLPEVPIDRIPALVPSLDLLQVLGWPLNITLHLSDVIVLLIACSSALAVRAVLHQTHFGRGIRACAQNPQLAQFCGVNLDRTIRWTFAFGGLLAGIAAFTFALYYERPVAYHGAESGLLAFAAAILGGIGNPIGALLSGLLIGICGAISDYFLSAEWTPVLLQTILIAVLVLRPYGITAELATEELSVSPISDAATHQSLDRPPRWHRALLSGLLLIGLIFPAIDLLLGLREQILAIEIGILILLALGLNLLLGLAGVLDLGYIVSFGIGAYTAALLLPYSVDLLAILLLGALLAGLFGYLKGQLARRLRSDYLAVVTLDLGLMFPQILINLNDWTGGTGGIAALPPPRLFSHVFASPTEKYYLVVLIVSLSILVSQRLMRSRIGRAWRAGGEDEVAAVSFGVDVSAYKTLAFILSSVIAGLAGVLFASSFSYIAPDLVGFKMLAMVIAMVILGGVGSGSGAIWGVLLIIGYDRFFIPWLGDTLAQIQPSYLHFGAAPDVRGLSYLTFGLAIYLTVLLRSRRRAGSS